MTTNRDQAMDALARANLVRAERKAWREAQKERTKPEGLDAFIALISDPPPWAYNWHLAEAMRACPRVGSIGVRYAINGFGIGFNLHTRIGWMNERQRDVVINWAERVKRSYYAHSARR